MTVDGRTVVKSTKLEPGQSIVVLAASPEAPSGTIDDAVIAEIWGDERIAVVDKPAGIVSHPAPGHRSGTLSQILSSSRGGGQVGLVHRLDADTSGLLAVTWDEEALREMREMLQARRVTREYLALVIGTPPTSRGTIDAPIGRDRRRRTMISTRTDSPREAVTHFEVLEALAGATLLRVALETGRTHQIRVHLAEAGLPVAGDPVYGRSGTAGLRRQFLHAARLAFRHPFSGEEIDLSSALPDDLAAALARIRESGA